MTTIEVTPADLPADVEALPVRCANVVTVRFDALWSRCAITVDGEPWLARGVDLLARVGRFTTIVVRDRDLIDAAGAPIITTDEHGEPIFATETVRIEADRVEFA